MSATWFHFVPLHLRCIPCCYVILPCVCQTSSPLLQDQWTGHCYPGARRSKGGWGKGSTNPPAHQWSPGSLCGADYPAQYHSAPASHQEQRTPSHLDIDHQPQACAPKNMLSAGSQTCSNFLLIACCVCRAVTSPFWHPLPLLGTASSLRCGHVADACHAAELRQSGVPEKDLLECAPCTSIQPTLRPAGHSPPTDQLS